MIKCNKGQVEIVGKGNNILTEYTVLTKNLKDHFSEEILREAFELAFMSEEELDKKLEEVKRELFDTLFNKILGRQED
ncbi:hypothetical protein B5F53_11760 [Blautia sp. An249]|uniref:50S ribosomal protein L29 n=1 Tax=Blautia sp. An249 TaxID=1965603 RepID=UPI000B391E06|nr:50S ribosomal protein L29 [Blautia sp. An249]OUO78217.1 hypothetical protein B5F53_11760 [Blautia sp. An249]